MPTLINLRVAETLEREEGYDPSHHIIEIKLRSKRFLQIQNIREHKKEYNLKTSISLVKETAKTKFVETMEAHFRLNIDSKYNDQ
ncbi:unnamed protein product [Lupinus luteus]|uniref:Uncharacterized protein n=1 Tax=Lupinus luteus TaxID=3873 RepID=A0AAV1XSU1_LUPLU